MELAILALLVLGYLVAAPWAAFSALSRAKDALARATNATELAAQQQAEIDALRSALVALQAGAQSDVAVQAAGEPAPDEAVSLGSATAAAEPPAQPEPEEADQNPAEPALSAEAAPADAATADTTSEDLPASADPAPAADEVPAAAAMAPATAPPEPQSAPAIAARDFEESIGSRWAVWVGGVALALGGLFLVRYSIEAGFFGPGIRLLMGAGFAAAAALASEYLRRREPGSLPAAGAIARLSGANIPGVLAGVSVLSAFGVIYAAYAVYGFLGPTLAFALMGAVGLAALAASLLHGSMLGLFGLVGSYVTPMLIGGSAPNFPALSLFVALVTVTAFLLHGRRPDRLVTLGAVAGHGAWAFLIAHAERGGFWAPFLLVVGSVAALALLKEWPRLRERRHGGAELFRPAAMVDPVGFAALAAPLVVAGIVWTAHGGPVPTLVAVLVAVLTATIAAVRHRDLAPLAPLAAAASAGVALLWPSGEGAIGIAPALILDLLRLDLPPDAAPGLTWSAALLALIVGAPSFHALLSGRGGGVLGRGCLAFASALGPVCLLLATALRSNGFERSLGFAALALLLAGALFAAAELILPVERRSGRSRTNPLALVGSSAYAAGGALALGLSVAFALRETWLVVGFAVAAAGVAIVASLRPIPLLRSMSAALATAALGRLIWKPIVGDVGSWPLFNWLILAYGLPALCFWIGALALKERQDRPLGVHQALAAFFAAAFVLLEIRQLFAGPDLVPGWSLIAGHYAGMPRNRLFEEVACHLAAIGLLGAAFQRLGQRLGGAVLPTCADIAAAALIVLSVAGLGAFLNPLFDATAVTGLVIANRLLLYVAVGGLLGVLARMLATGGKPSRLGEALAACAAMLVTLGVVLIVRHGFSGPQLVPVGREAMGFAEAVMLTLALLGLAAAARIWREASGGRIAGLALHTLAFLAIGWAILSLGLWRNPLVDLSGVDGPVIFNRILWGYGALAIAFAGAAFWMGPAQPPIALALARTAKAFALLGLFLLLRHGFHGPFLASEVPVTLAEAGTYATLGFVAALAALIAGSVRLFGQRVATRSEVAAGLACGAFALFSGILANPLLTGAPLTGPLLLDNALVGYLLPAALAFAAARWARAHLASPHARRLFGAAAIIGGLAYLLIEVRRGFVGPDLLAPQAGATELYAYSAALLLYGVALLALGFRLASKDLRLASLAVVTVAICKAFLVDMAGLEGLLRALSFIGLGACLVGIGLAYQHLLRRERLPVVTPAALPGG